MLKGDVQAVKSYIEQPIEMFILVPQHAAMMVCCGGCGHIYKAQSLFCIDIVLKRAVYSSMLVQLHMYMHTSQGRALAVACVCSVKTIVMLKLILFAIPWLCKGVEVARKAGSGCSRFQQSRSCEIGVKVNFIAAWKTSISLMTRWGAVREQCGLLMLQTFFWQQQHY